ncbi:hypothetical protein WK59_24880 [Burkholderia ubonensis]|uniref:hypothetical protein n=1 Tax=Burkholderia ubonensis TaxID=101571 RepID=UPI000757F14D|nr:hypothetical protein [Burkholderia ubonensis]KVT78327.1 hypothetical protein WK59_24880 [Burkholderia ubonensis]
MSIAPTTTGHPHDGVPAETAAAPRRDGAPSAFAQTLRRLERDMWQGATAGPALQARMSRPLAPLRASPPPVRASDAVRTVRAPFGTAAPRPPAGHHAHEQHGTATAADPAHTSSRRPPATGGDAPPDGLARPLPATAATTICRAQPAPDPQPAHAAGRRARVPEPDAAAYAASLSPCRLSLLTGTAGISIAIRAAGIDDAALAQRTFAELRRVGVSDARLFINGRLFTATHPLPGE